MTIGRWYSFNLGDIEGASRGTRVSEEIIDARKSINKRIPEQKQMIKLIRSWIRNRRNNRENRAN